jgi:MoxR-like ATPase
MAEQQVSVDGQTWPLPQPFIVLATNNPIEYEGTYPLPEAQLDRLASTSAAPPAAASSSPPSARTFPATRRAG